MRKFNVLVLLAGLFVSSMVSPIKANAGEFKPIAEFVEEFYYGDAGNQPDREENFGAFTRIRFGFDYIQSENLSATMLFEYSDHEWGNNGVDFTSDPDAGLLMRLAYIDWTIPNTEIKVRMGRQGVVTPSYAFGSPILDDRADAVTLAYNINDTTLITGSWLRMLSDDDPAKRVDTQGNFKLYHDDADAYLLTAEFAYDKWKIAPWAMYFNIGTNATTPYGGKPAFTGHTRALALGVSAELSIFDPFVFAIDTMYNSINADPNKVLNPYAEDSFDSFYIGATASYALNNGTVALKGWYATGNDKEDEMHKNSNAYINIGGGFGATSIFFDDNEIAGDPFNNGASSPAGTWGIILEYADFSFIEKLSHTARVAYIAGTNEANIVNGIRVLDDTEGDFFANFTDKDSAIEINFNSTYEIYQNLSATLELGYMFVDMGNLAYQDSNKGLDDDIFRSTIRFVYSF